MTTSEETAVKFGIWCEVVGAWLVMGWLKHQWWEEPSESDVGGLRGGPRSFDSEDAARDWIDAAEMKFENVTYLVRAL